MDPQRLAETKQLLINLSITYGPKLIVGILFLIAGSLAARWVGNFFSKTLEKRQLEPPVRLLLVRLMRMMVFFLFVFMALENLEVKLMPLIAGLGIAGVGIGLALQGVLQNVVAGLTIIFTKPFRVGEYIELLGVQGDVVAVELFSTTLHHPDRSRVVIPNRKIVGEILHNHGIIRQLDLSVGVAYQTDLERAIAIVREALQKNPRVLKEPQPVVGVSMLADSSINIAVKPWVKVVDYIPARADIYLAVIESFRNAHISIPFPQHEVRLLNPAPTQQPTG
jgi:small conductance mechanosensitive channel